MKLVGSSRRMALIQALILLSAASICSSTEGIYITNRARIDSRCNIIPETGFNIIVKPENVVTSYPRDTMRAYLSVRYVIETQPQYSKIPGSRRTSVRNYKTVSESQELKWSSHGKYYYYGNTEHLLYFGQLIEPYFFIQDMTSHQQIYSKRYSTYYIESRAKECVLDDVISMNSSDSCISSSCSEVLSLNEQFTTPMKQAMTTRPTIKRSTSRKLYSVVVTSTRSPFHREIVNGRASYYQRITERTSSKSGTMNTRWSQNVTIGVVVPLVIALAVVPFIIYCLVRRRAHRLNNQRQQTERDGNLQIEADREREITGEIVEEQQERRQMDELAAAESMSHSIEPPAYSELEWTKPPNTYSLSNETIGQSETGREKLPSYDEALRIM